jgi:hypothetical protein
MANDLLPIQGMTFTQKKESFNNQEGQADFILRAIKNLLDKGSFLSGGRDELVRPFNLIYECCTCLSNHLSLSVTDFLSVTKLAVPFHSCPWSWCA